MYQHISPTKQPCEVYALIIPETEPKFICLPLQKQTCETGASERKVVYSGATVSRRWGDAYPQKPILTSLVKLVILIGSWWEFRRGKIPKVNVDVQFLLRKRSGSKEGG